MNQDKVFRLPSINSVFISGRLVSDGEKRSSSEGKFFIKFRLASNRRYRKGNQWVEVPLYIDVLYSINDLVYLDEILRRLAKGTPVVVEGTLNYREWESDGRKLSSYYINARRVHLMERRVEEREDISDISEQEGLPPDDIPF